jgi:hypothetical protein
MLRLPTIRDRFDEIAAAVEREQLSYLGFLAELVLAECDDRDRRRAARRIRDAGFPRRSGGGVPVRRQPGDQPAVIGQLATCDWVKADVPWLIGDSGTGKTHLLIAAEQGYRVRYTLASKLVNELVDAADDRQLSKLIARYGRVDLILIDELGYGAGPARRRTSLPGTDRTGGTFRGGDRLQRAVLPLDQDLHRPQALRRHRRPVDLRRADHRNRHRVLPARPRPPATTKTAKAEPAPTR